jgi:spermidine synthase
MLYKVTSAWEYETVARATSPRGEIVLRQRHADDAHPVFELRVNGVCVMDSAETSSERALASHVLALVEHPQHVVVGGLGLGVTTRTLLADERVQRVTIAEIESCLVDWMQADVIPNTSWLVDDAQVEIVIEDIRSTVSALPTASTDAIVLDVDNGPGHLVYDTNAEIYQEPFLHLCRTTLRPGGVLAVWSSHDSDELAAGITRAFGGCARHPIDVTLQGRRTEDWLFVGSPRTA